MHRPEHEHVAVGEVDELDDAVDEGVAECDEREDQAIRQADDQNWISWSMRGVPQMVTRGAIARMGQMCVRGGPVMARPERFRLYLRLPEAA